MNKKDVHGDSLQSKFDYSRVTQLWHHLKYTETKHVSRYVIFLNSKLYKLP